MITEGYIARWDPTAGRGTIRTAGATVGEVPFGAGDLQFGHLLPRIGMAVVFDCVAEAGAPRATEIRPWATSLADEAPAGRRRRPVFQATGTGHWEGRPSKPVQQTPAVAAPFKAAVQPPRGAPDAPATATGRSGPAEVQCTRPSALESLPRAPASRNLSAGPVWPWALLIAAYLVVLGLGVAWQRWPLAVALFAPGLWLASYLGYWLDKHAVRTRDTRQREVSLHLLDAAGGWPGGWLAMQVLHHKLRRTDFRRRHRIAVALHGVAVVLWWVWRTPAPA